MICYHILSTNSLRKSVCGEFVCGDWRLGLNPPVQLVAMDSDDDDGVVDNDDDDVVVDDDDNNDDIYATSSPRDPTFTTSRIFVHGFCS